MPATGNFIYPPRPENGAQVTPPAPVGGGGGLTGEWVEVTDAGMGSLNDPNSRADGLTYTSGGGWDLSWASGGSTDDNGVEEGPSRRAALSQYAPDDFSWDTHSVEVALRADLADFNEASPFQVGPFIALRESSAAGSIGCYMKEGNGFTGLGSLYNVLSNNHWSLNNTQMYSHLIRKNEDRAVIEAIYRSSLSEAAVAERAGLINFGPVLSASLADLQIVIGGTVQTTSALTAHTNNFRAYIRIIALPRYDAIGALPDGPA